MEHDRRVTDHPGGIEFLLGRIVSGMENITKDFEELKTDQKATLEEVRVLSRAKNDHEKRICTMEQRPGIVLSLGMKIGGAIVMLLTVVSLALSIVSNAKVFYKPDTTSGAVGRKAP